MDAASKIKSRTDLLLLRKKWNHTNQSVVFTNGCFDILHRGHAEYLQQAKALGDVLIVGLNSDASVRRLKGAPRPFVSREDRAFLLASLAAVDYVCIFEEDTPQRLIEELQPDILAKGDDYPIEDVVGRDVVERRGGRVLTIPLTPNRSTSELLNKINASTQIAETQ